MSKITNSSNSILNKNEMQKCVQNLRKLVLKDDLLKKLRTDDECLLRYLHCTDFDVTQALQRMKSYSTLIKEHPDWFGKTSPLKMRKQIEVKDEGFLRGKDKCGRPIIVIKLGKLDVSGTPLTDQCQIIDMWYELIFNDPQTQTNGLCVIMDTKNLPWKFLKWLTPLNIKIALQKIDLYSFKAVLIHVVNTTFFANKIMKVIYPLLNEKIRNMFKFHFENWASLHGYISPNVLPPEYRGIGSDIDFQECITVLFQHKSIIEDRLKYIQILTPNN